MIETKIVNVVATAALNQEVDLEELRKFDDVFHDSDVYGGRVAYFKTKTMQGKVSIFTSGKMISVGTKSEDAAFQELEAAKDFFVKRGLVEDISLEPKIRNLVVCVDFGKGVNLEELAFKEHVIYEPEQFPGGILRLNKPYKTSVLIFASGKAVLTGLTSKNQIKAIIECVNKIIEECN